MARSAGAASGNAAATTGPGGGKRREQASLRREELLRAALALFSERGFRDTSVRDITRAAGVTEAVLYHYFANKVDLWTAVLATYSPFSRVAEVLADAAALSVEEALRGLGHELLRLLRARQHLVLALVSEAPGEPEVAAVLQRFVQGVAADLSAFLAERQRRGEIAPGLDVGVAARAFQGALLTRFLTTSLVPRPDDAAEDREMVDALVATLVRGLAPRG